MDGFLMLWASMWLSKEDFEKEKRKKDFLVPMKESILYWSMWCPWKRNG